MCVNCIRSQVDITEGIQKQVTVLWCKECGRYLQPPKHWLRAELESKELLTFCIKKIKGLNKVGGAVPLLTCRAHRTRAGQGAIPGSSFLGWWAPRRSSWWTLGSSGLSRTASGSRSSSPSRCASSMGACAFRWRANAGQGTRSEHVSMWLAVSCGLQAEVFNGTILQQSFVVDYTVEYNMCPDCNRANANPNSWIACAQVRRKG